MKKSLIIFLLAFALMASSTIADVTVNNVTDNEPKYLNSPETEIFKKSKELYGFYESKQINLKLKSIIVVEGYLDVLSLFQNGITNVVATLGTALTVDQFMTLCVVVDEIIFCFDGDASGRKAAWKSMKMCLLAMKGDKRIKFLLLPKGEDPDSFINANSKKNFLLKIKNASLLIDYFLKELLIGIDLNSVDDRIFFIFKVRNVLEKMPNGIFKHMIYLELSNVSGISLDMLKNTNLKKNVKDVNKNNIVNVEPISPAIRAAALLIESKYLVCRILLTNYDLFFLKDMFGISLFKQIMEVIRNKMNVTTSEIISNLSKDAIKIFDVKRLKEIIAIIPNSGITEEFLGSLRQMDDYVNERIIDEIHRKRTKISPTCVDKKILNILLVEASTIKI